MPPPLADLSSQMLQIEFNQILGIGSLATVYAGTLDGEPVAVKELPPISLGFATVLEGGKPVIIMERMATTLQKKLQSGPSIPLSSRILWLKQIAAALSHLHQLPDPVVHGDLRMSSILIDADGNAKLNNIGLYKLKKASRSYRTPDCHLAFLPPESYSEVGNGPTKAHDVYSFGMIVYETVTGRVPFDGTPAGAIPFLVMAGKRPERPDAGNDVPDWVWEIIERCWRQDLGGRPDMEEVEVLIGRGGIGGEAVESARVVEPPTYEQLNVSDLEYALNASIEEHHGGGSSSMSSQLQFLVPTPTILPPTYGEALREDLDILWDFLPTEFKSRNGIKDHAQLRNLKAGGGWLGDRVMFEWNGANRLVAIRLKTEGISGKIPVEFVALTELEEL
ncbi:kinase-like protein [Rhizoclosmatium globosum]|uniref:Kinase-like protein n=1 Tax=Rhizoclosmatium globosum TaxID=329046 RepID=A0A1Y2C1A9_9FUNG|nr:kinase-like protein [Rhizoclosmatium globosum]|eukprot:ORY40810.1 kinase-like protein [Rhizoclosmatium globosum]